MIGDLFNSISNAANGFLNAAGSVWNTMQNRKNVKDTIAANRSLAEYAYAQDFEMWNRQNAYNSPQAQMERLKAAGLNPNLVYGSGAVSGNTSGPTPKYNAPTVDFSQRQAPVDIPAIIGAYNDFRLKQAQIDNVKAATDSKNIATALKAQWGFKTAEQDFENKKWKGYTMQEDLWQKQRTNPMKAGILGNQQTASEYMSRIAAQQLANMKAQNANINYQAIYNRYKAQWASMGFTSSDNIGFRVIANWLHESGINLFDAAGKVGNSLFKQ